MLDQTTSIDDILDQIRCEADQLPNLIVMLEDEPPEVRDVWHWRWEGIIERVESLRQEHRAGVMSAAQEQEFLAISRLLAECRASIEALGCRIPLELEQSIDALG